MLRSLVLCCFCFLFCVVVAGFVFTTALLAFGVVFLFGFAFWASFGCDFAADDSLVNMAECCGSVVSAVDACCVTVWFTSLVVCFVLCGCVWSVVCDNSVWFCDCV